MSRFFTFLLIAFFVGAFAFLVSDIHNAEQTEKRLLKESRVKSMVVLNEFLAGGSTHEAVFDAIESYGFLSGNHYARKHVVLKEHIETFLKVGIENPGMSEVVYQRLRVWGSYTEKRAVLISGHNPTYGARPIRRTIQDRIENIISEMILDGKIKNGGQIKVDFISGDFKFTIKSPTKKK